MSRQLAIVALAVATACSTDDAAEPAVATVTQSMSVCAGSTTVYGIDVSRFQGDIDWDQVAASGVKYAFIQISRSLTDIDVKFPYNWQRAKEVGILRGAYQRFQPDQDAIAQAELFVQTLGTYVAGDLPPVLDVEDDKGLPAATIAARVDEWSTYVEQHVGLRPIIYTGFYFWRDKVGADFSDHHLWIANYGSSCPLVPPSWARWTFHQYSSSATIPGITANTVDVNKFNGTYTELQALAKLPTDACLVDVTTDTEGSVVDDASPCFFAGGDPRYMRSESAGYGTSLRWTHATDNAQPANFGTWTLSFASAGRYRVEAFTPAPFGESKQAVYNVKHGEMLSAIAVDQSAIDGWQSLGELDFVEGAHGQAVRLDDNTGEPNDTDTQIVFDALRFTKVDVDQESPDQPPAASGCATTHTSGDPVLLLALLFVVGSLGYGAHTRTSRRAFRRHAPRVRH